MRKLVLLYCIFLFSNSIGATLLINENIQNWTARINYGSYTQAIPAGTVNMTSCKITPSGSASGSGSSGYVDLQAGSGALELPELSSVGTVEFHLRAGAASRSIKLQKFNGTAWEDLITISNIGTGGTPYLYVINSEGAIKLRLALQSYQIFVHDIIITDYPLPAPVITGATSILHNSFTANWNSVTGATGYRMDVYDVSQVNEPINMDFEGYSTASPPPDWALSSGNCYISSGSEAFSGTAYAQLTSNGAWLRTPLITDPKTCSFQVKTSTATSQMTLKLQYSVNGTIWYDEKEFYATGSNTGNLINTYLNKTVDLNFTGNYYLRWLISSYNSGRVHLDDVVVTGSVPSVEYVPGYENLDVGNVNTFTVTGLVPMTPYFYVVRGYNENRISDDSNEMEVTTNDYTLPVELSSFTASVIAQDYVLLNWTSQSETNLLGYYLYRGTGSGLSSAEQIPSLINATNTSQTAEYSFADREVNAGNSYHYWLQNLDLNGESDFHGPVSVTIPESGDFTPEYILDTRLLPAYPNPFGRSTGTRFHYTLKSGGTVRIEVFNLKGQKVWSAVRQHAKAGDFHLHWNGTDKSGNPLGSGVYHYRLSCGNYRADRKVLLK